MATQQGVGWLIRAVILLVGSATVLFGIFICALTASADVLYEEDFSSDPGWVSDGSGNFSWDNVEGVYRSIFINGPQVSPVDRFAGIQVPFDPTQSFTLSWKQRIASSTGSFFATPFGLLSPGLMGSTTSALYGDGMAQYQYGVLFGNLFATQLDVRTTEGISLGGGGTSSIVPDLGAWYRQEFRYDGAAHSLTHTITSESSGAVLSSETVSQSGASRPLFGPNMQYIGMSYHPYVNASSQLSSKSGMVEVWIDDIKLEDGNTDEAPQPEGASSVLFLPGIQSSRLYQDGLLGTEDRIWPPSPNFGEDVYDLAMTNEGVSVNNVYTRDVIDSIFGIGSVYGGFLDFLEEQKTAQFPIKDYTAFAYDWRYSIDDIVNEGVRYENETRSMIDEIEDLAADSFTGKATIIAHSNGGLVAKALLKELEERNLANKVDRVIFIGTPQLGTPKAIGSILHGYDQGDQFGGIILNAHAAREVINNMPGAYSLLPSEQYFAAVPGTLIDFGTSTALASYRATYDNSISSFSKYKEFLLGTTDTGRTLTGHLGEPAKANSELLQDAFQYHANTLDNWDAPEGIEVIEIIGVGLPTMRSLTYREIKESTCTQPQTGSASCVTTNFVKPLAVLSKYGDATVIKESAEGYAGEKTKYYFNLKLFNEENLNDIRREHFNITETSEIQKLIESLLNTINPDINYVSTTMPVLNNEYSIVTIDSPVRLLALDSSGKRTGVIIEDGQRKILEEIPGTQYFEFGDTKYYVVPRQTEYTMMLRGEAYGGYTLTISTLKDDDIQSIQHQLTNASATPQMEASFAYNNDNFSIIKTDYNGDGFVDRETTVDGAAVRYTYAEVRVAIKALKLTKIQEKVLLDALTLAEEAGKRKSKLPALVIVERVTLQQVVNLLEIQKKRGIITVTQFRNLEKMILSLIKK